MKKYNVIICAAALIALMASCGNKHQFTINGTVDGTEMNGKTFYLFDLYGESNTPLDSTVVTDGKYTFKGTVDEPKNVIVDAADAPFTVRIILEPGTIVINNDSIGGTPLNDKGETKGIKTALGEDGARKAMISSTKSMHGHMLGATGAVELIISALALMNGVIPPTIHLDQPDPECDLDYTPHTARQWQADIAISNTFGFGGQNSTVALRKV